MSLSSRPVCIVGAGVSGLAAALTLGRAGVSVVVLDKSRGVSGRAATRRRDIDDTVGGFGCWRFDHGAQVLTPEPGSRADRLVREVVAPDALIELDAPTVPFDNDGTLRPDRTRSEAPRLALRDGYAALGRALTDATPGLDLRLNTTVARLAHSAEGWTVEAETPEGSARLGPFRAVVLTPPAPQAAAIVEASSVDAGTRDALSGALRAATYRSQFAVVLGFDEPVALPNGAYGLVNAPENGPGRHDVAWVADETRKPGRAPGGAGLLVAQMSGAWTEAHYDDAKESVVAGALGRIEALVGPLPVPLWTDSQRWRYSLPDGGVDADALAPAEALGLYVAGDGVVGKGRVHLALEDGLDVAERILAGPDRLPR